MERITMSKKELQRVEVLVRYLEKEIDRPRAASEMGISERQVSRIAKVYREEGAPGLAHRSRGQPSPRRISEADLDKAIKKIEEVSTVQNKIKG